MTYHPKSEFLDVMMSRGYLADCTDLQGLDDARLMALADTRSARAFLLLADASGSLA